ncbi:hypothetical protein SEVIR_9G143200v4 [Setaria viridis]|uniref:Ubiquitin-like protease family profile domain-containing protein n=1 Tax=Setaria viridis TaxID=4556 RepID=A0A4U6STC4_SETVI|nr:uncharacterized protein LOC117835396 [Setaria viridis]TKV92127.1 hypothetical protein SEVIR_9G143200v2 [Setaria viridis]
MNHAEVSGLLCVSMNETDGGEESYGAEYPKMDQDTSHETAKFDVVMATSALYTDNINTNACLDEYHMSGIQAMEEIRFGSAQPFEIQPKGMVTNSEEESMPSSPETSSTSNYDMPGYMEQNLQHVHNAYDAMVERAGPVVLSPAFIICDETSHLQPRLTFSLDGVKIEYLNLDSFEGEKMIALQWEISNIISISCKWAQSVGYAFITLLAGSEVESGNAAPVRVQFCLDDSQWSRRQQKIWELQPRYQEIWKDIPSDDFTSENWSIEPNLFFPRQYFSSTEDFEDIIYPQGDPDAVSISKRDAELLLPETFVNDTIIDFYIKYLSTRIESTEKRRYHFFNSFFFRKLADLDKDQGRAPEGRAAFLRVRKWTRKINVFEKDFLFIPVNFNLHWSLIVICYPGEVATSKDGDAKLAAELPCILHMDSLKGSHTGLKDIIQSYLWEEWKERHPESASDISDKFLNLRFVSLELPQQDNSFDCGLFLLHYVELFLMDAPSNFNPLKIDVFSDFLSGDWFAPAEASLKRSVVRKLIHEVVTGSFQNHPKLACGSEQLDERHQRCSNAEQEPAGEFLAQRRSDVEPETVCKVRDGTHELQPSESICLNDSEEKRVPASGCMLDTGRVSIVDVQNRQESEVCAADEDTIVCMSNQDEKNELLIAESNNQLNMRSCAPKEDEVLKGSNCVVTDKEHGESLFLSLDNNQKIPSQAEVEVQDIMVSTSCADNEIAAQVIACQEHSFQRSAEVGDGCFRPSQDMDSVMMLDSSKDDDGLNPERMTAEGDCGGPHEDMDSVTLHKDAVDTKCEDSLLDPIAENAIIENVNEISTADSVTVETAIIENVKDVSTTADNVNHGELYVSSQLAEGNTDNGMTGAGNTDNGTTGVSTASPGLKEENIDKVVADDCTHESDINAKYSSELKVGNTDIGGITVSSDVNEGNTDQIIAGDCANETDVNADGEGADNCKHFAMDGAAPCADAATCTDGVVLSIDVPCSTINETVSENISSDAQSPLPDGTSKLVDRPCSPKNETSEITSLDGKRPAPDGTSEENDIVIPGDKCTQKDGGQGTDAKIERHYKRRKVLALEKQRSFSGATSLDKVLALEKQRSFSGATSLD